MNGMGSWFVQAIVLPSKSIRVKRALAGRPEVLGPVLQLRALKGLHVKVGSFDVVLKLPPGLNFFLRLFEKLPPFENDIFFNGLIFLLNC